MCGSSLALQQNLSEEHMWIIYSVKKEGVSMDFWGSRFIAHFSPFCAPCAAQLIDVWAALSRLVIKKEKQKAF